MLPSGIRLTNLKPELTDTWPRRLGGDQSTEAEIDELEKFVAIKKTQADKVQRYKLHSHFMCVACYYYYYYLFHNN